MTLRRHRALLVGIALAALPAAACTGGGPTSGRGDTAVDVEITDGEGRPSSLTALGGKPLVVNMWATWCKPCVKEMPDFDEVSTSTEGVRIIGVNVGDEPEAAAEFADGLGVTYDQFTDAQGALSDAFGVSGLPATAFITADGTVLEVSMGALSADSLRAKISEHFPEAVMEGES